MLYFEPLWITEPENKNLVLGVTSPKLGFPTRWSSGCWGSIVSQVKHLIPPVGHTGGFSVFASELRSASQMGYILFTHSS